MGVQKWVLRHSLAPYPISVQSPKETPPASQNLPPPTLSSSYRSCPRSSWHFHTWDAALGPGQEPRPQRPKTHL